MDFFNGFRGRCPLKGRGRREDQRGVGTLGREGAGPFRRAGRHIGSKPVDFHFFGLDSGFQCFALCQTGSFSGMATTLLIPTVFQRLGPLGWLLGSFFRANIGCSTGYVGLWTHTQVERG